jgi:UDP-glucose 4-epimerase
MLNRDTPQVVARRCPGYEEVYMCRGYRMLEQIDRVYVNEAARRDLGWRPASDFQRVLDHLDRREPIASPLARAVGSKGYHDRVFEDGPFPVQD